MPDVIADTSPLQYLYQAGVLFLLPELFGGVVIPEAVAGELEAGKARGVSLPDPGTCSWLQVRPVEQRAFLPLVTHLGNGEKEVLALGLESLESLLLLDDMLARRHAGLLSLRVMGTLGVLLLGKKHGKLEAVRPVMDHLEALGFRLSVHTRRAILELAQELE